MGHIEFEHYIYSMNLVWIIVSFLEMNVGDYVFLCYLLCKGLVGSLHEDTREDTGSWTHGNSNLTRNLAWRMQILHPHK